ncbi:hypothetical protein MKA31_20305 [[Clostridium] innocuum]|uniref:DnaB-like helicase N-terminal domain-containing protein n=1 Tax=Clostridium innocuum TaxID=1522 RepID=UPI00214966CF|nr:DnaB-like helicase N-terminal domain-containing protein [[Clostridium] innocuum]MCR0274440.1 hypothetical protein [[Clostridium] innocuum]
MSNSSIPVNVKESIDGAIALLDFILSSLEYESKDVYLIQSLKSIQYMLKDCVGEDSDPDVSSMDQTLYSAELTNEDEKKLLKQMILYPNTISYLLDSGVSVQAFHDFKHKAIFESILELFKSSVDITRLITHLNERGLLEAVGGAEYIIQLSN